MSGPPPGYNPASLLPDANAPIVGIRGGGLSSLGGAEPGLTGKIRELEVKLARAQERYKDAEIALGQAKTLASSASAGKNNQDRLKKAQEDFYNIDKEVKGIEAQIVELKKKLVPTGPPGPKKPEPNARPSAPERINNFGLGVGEVFSNAKPMEGKYPEPKGKAKKNNENYSIQQPNKIIIASNEESKFAPERINNFGLGVGEVFSNAKPMEGKYPEAKETAKEDNENLTIEQKNNNSLIFASNVLGQQRYKGLAIAEEIIGNRTKAKTLPAEVIEKLSSEPDVCKTDKGVLLNSRCATHQIATSVSLGKSVATDMEKEFAKNNKSAAKSNGEPSGQAPSEETPSAQAPSGENPRGENPRGENPRGENPRGQAPSGENPRGETPRGQPPPGKKQSSFERMKEFLKRKDRANIKFGEKMRKWGDKLIDLKRKITAKFTTKPKEKDSPKLKLLLHIAKLNKRINTAIKMLSSIKDKESFDAMPPLDRFFDIFLNTDINDLFKSDLENLVSSGDITQNESEYFSEIFNDAYDEGIKEIRRLYAELESKYGPSEQPSPPPGGQPPPRSWKPSEDEINEIKEKLKGYFKDDIIDKIIIIATNSIGEIKEKITNFRSLQLLIHPDKCIGNHNDLCNFLFKRYNLANAYDKNNLTNIRNSQKNKNNLVNVWAEFTALVNKLPAIETPRSGPTQPPEATGPPGSNNENETPFARTNTSLFNNSNNNNNKSLRNPNIYGAPRRRKTRKQRKSRKGRK